MADGGMPWLGGAQPQYAPADGGHGHAGMDPGAGYPAPGAGGWAPAPRSDESPKRLRAFGSYAADGFGDPNAVKIAPGHGYSAPHGGDTASSFLRDARSQILAPQLAPDAGGLGWHAQLRQHLDRGRAAGGFAQQPAAPMDPASGMPQGAAAAPAPAAGADSGVESTLLSEDEFQCNSAIEFGAGVAMSGCTMDGHLRDGDEMPKLEPLSNSVCLRITPTAIIFLHQYDRNFILEVPITELYEITEDSDHKVVLLHTRNANGSALIELACSSQRKRIGIYKTLCIRKNALERLKRQQQQISRAYYQQEQGAA